MPTDIATTATETFDSVINAPAGGDPRTAASVRNMGQALADQSLWTWRRLQMLLGSFCPIGGYAPSAISGVDTGADELTLVGHGLNNNDPVRLVAATGGSLPGGLSQDTVYYAIKIDADTIQVSTTSGPGSAVDITSALSGDVYIVKITDPAVMLPTVGSVAAGKLSAILARFGRLTGSANTWIANNIFEGAVTFSDAGGSDVTLANKLLRSGTGTRDVYRATAHTQAGATQSITTTDFDIHFVVEPTADCDSTLSDGTNDGQEIEIVATAAFATFDINFKSNGNTIASFPSGAQRCAVRLVWSSPSWIASMWTKDVSNI